MTNFELPTWIDTALATGTGRKLIVAQDDRWGFMAILDFNFNNQRIGGNGATANEAVKALENLLMEDAADEMVKAGDV